MNKIKDNILVGTHKNIDVYLSTGSNQFRTKDERITNYYDSFAKVTEAIDRMLSAETQLKLKDLKLTQPMLTSNGDKVTLTGFNRTDSNYLVVKDGKSENYGGHLFPVEPWVEQALLRRAELEKEVKDLTTRLDRISISKRGYYGGRIAAEDYPELIGNLQHAITKAAKLAKEMAK